MSKSVITINKIALAKIFVENHFFDDDNPVSEAYGVLTELYSTLSCESKEELHRLYKIYIKKTGGVKK